MPNLQYLDGASLNASACMQSWEGQSPTWVSQSYETWTSAEAGQPSLRKRQATKIVLVGSKKVIERVSGSSPQFPWTTAGNGEPCQSFCFPCNQVATQNIRALGQGI